MRRDESRLYKKMGCTMLLQKMFFIVLICLLFTGVVLAQDSSELPEFYYTILNKDLISAILVIVGAVKLLRNLFGDRTKGWVAVLITVLGAMVYGVIQFGFSTHGIWYGLAAGLFAALSFYLTKNVNKTMALGTDIRYDFWVSLGKMLKFFVVRK